MSEEEKKEIEIMLEDMFFWQGKSSFITRHRYKELSKKMYEEIEKLQKENEEYHRIKKDLIKVNKKIYDVETIDEFIKTIDKLQNNYDKLFQGYNERVQEVILKEKVIDLMAFEIAEDTGSCPLDIYDWENKKFDNCNNCNNTSKECFIEYFYKKAEEENER